MACLRDGTLQADQEQRPIREAGELVELGQMLQAQLGRAQGGDVGYPKNLCVVGQTRYERELRHFREFPSEQLACLRWVHVCMYVCVCTYVCVYVRI